jgi:hypothetical protein
VEGGSRLGRVARGRVGVHGTESCVCVWGGEGSGVPGLVGSVDWVDRCVQVMDLLSITLRDE